MKKYYVALPIAVIFLIITIIAVLGFIWETIDIGRFIPFAFFSSVGIPCLLETILLLLFCQYITIDKQGIKKYLFKKKLVEFSWGDIREIKVDRGTIFISLEELISEKEYCNKQKTISIMYSEQVIQKIKEYNIEGKIKVNF